MISKLADHVIESIKSDHFGGGGVIVSTCIGSLSALFHTGDVWEVEESWRGEKNSTFHTNFTNSRCAYIHRKMTNNSEKIGEPSNKALDLGSVQVWSSVSTGAKAERTGALDELTMLTVGFQTRINFRYARF